MDALVPRPHERGDSYLDDQAGHDLITAADCPVGVHDR
jgi:hypothetical protein